MLWREYERHDGLVMWVAKGARWEWYVFESFGKGMWEGLRLLIPRLARPDKGRCHLFGRIELMPSEEGLFTPIEGCRWLWVTWALRREVCQTFAESLEATRSLPWDWDGSLSSFDPLEGSR